MHTVEEIEEAIAGLTRAEFRRLTDKLIAQREAAWDVQIEADAASGRLDALWAEAEKEIAEGESEPLDAFLGHQKL